MDELEIKIKNARRILRLVRNAKTSNTHGQNGSKIKLSWALTGVKNEPENPFKLKALDKAIISGERFLHRVAHHDMYICRPDICNEASSEEQIDK